MASQNNNSQPEAHNSLYQKLDQVETRRQQLKLSFPTQSTEKKVPAKPQQLPTLNPRLIHHQNFQQSLIIMLTIFFVYFCSRERTKQHESGKLQFSPSEIYDFTSDDLVDLGEIGRGAFGSVNKMIFKKTDKVMAVKVRGAQVKWN